MVHHDVSGTELARMAALGRPAMTIEDQMDLVGAVLSHRHALGRVGVTQAAQVDDAHPARMANANCGIAVSQAPGIEGHIWSDACLAFA